MRRLRPLSTKPDKVFKWYDLLLPVMDHLNQEKDLASECQGILLDGMTAEDVNGAEVPDKGAAILLAERHIAIWLEECDASRRDGDTIRIAKEAFLRETLVLYGKRRPKVPKDTDSICL